MRRRYRILLITAIPVLTGVAVAGAIFNWAAADFVSPERAPIPDTRMTWLETPAAHGIKITEGSIQQGKTPYLLVTADPVAGPAERGTILRDQLQERGRNLPEFGDSRGLIVILHGRRGRKESFLPVAERFSSAGFDCVIPDLSASGDSGYDKQGFATHPHEISLVPDLLEALGRGEEPVFLWGQSMGGCYATRAARELGDRCAGLVVLSTFDDLEPLVADRVREVAGRVAGPTLWMLHRLVDWKGGADFSQTRPVDWAGEVKCPVLVLHGDRDTHIPPARGRALHDAFAASDKRFLEVPGAGHNNVLITEMQVYAEMAGWMLDRLR